MASVPKGGQQARRAALMCQNKRFWLYLDHRWRAKHKATVSDFPDGTHNAVGATRWLRRKCGIESRAEIDHNEQARAMLDRIAADYSKWERQQRASNRAAGGEA